MTRLSNHQSDAGQGVEFQSRQSHTDHYKYKKYTHIWMQPAMHTSVHTQSHKDTFWSLQKMSNVNLGMRVQVAQCSFVRFDWQTLLLLSYVIKDGLLCHCLFLKTVSSFVLSDTQKNECLAQVLKTPLLPTFIPPYYIKDPASVSK